MSRYFNKNFLLLLFVALLSVLLSTSCSSDKLKEKEEYDPDFDAVIKTIEIGKWNKGGCKLLFDFFELIEEKHLSVSRDDRQIINDRMFKVAAQIYLSLFLSAAEIEDKEELKKTNRAINKLFREANSNGLDKDCSSIDKLLLGLNNFDSEQDYNHSFVYLKLIYPALFKSLDPWSSFVAVEKELADSLKNLEEPVDLGIKIYIPEEWYFGAENPDYWLLKGVSATFEGAQRLIPHRSKIVAISSDFPRTFNKKTMVKNISYAQYQLIWKQTKNLKIWLENGEQFQIKKDLKNPQTVYLNYLSPKKEILYLSIENFHDNSSLALAINLYLKEGDLNAPQLVIVDLRNNSGGYDFQLEEILSSFLLPLEPICFYVDKQQSEITPVRVSSRSRYLDLLTAEDDEQDGEFLTKQVIAYRAIKGFFIDYPLIVLQNFMTASAAEIFAAAISDNGKGLIAGSRSFQKPASFYREPLFKIVDDNGQTYYAKISLANNHVYRITGQPLGTIAPEISLKKKNSAEIIKNYFIENIADQEVVSKIEATDPYQLGGKIFMLERDHLLFNDDGPDYWPSPPAFPLEHALQRKEVGEPFYKQLLEIVAVGDYQQFATNYCQNIADDCQLDYLFYLFSQLKEQKEGVKSPR